MPLEERRRDRLTIVLKQMPLVHHGKKPQLTACFRLFNGLSVFRNQHLVSHLLGVSVAAAGPPVTCQ